MQLQISCTCTNPIYSPIFLTPFDIKICNISDDIPDEILDEHILVSVAAVRSKIREHSSNQALRYTCQCFLTSVLLKEVIKRDKQEHVMLKNIVETTSRVEITTITKSNLQYCATLSMPLLAENVVIYNSDIKAVTPLIKVIFLFFSCFVTVLTPKILLCI